MDRLIDALRLLEGAYALIVMTPEGMIACRDPLGIRPLQMGRDRRCDAVRLVKPSPSTWSVRNSIGRSNRASDQGRFRRQCRFAPSLRRKPFRGPASSSMSISAAPIRSSTDAASTRRARRSAPSSRARRLRGRSRGARARQRRSGRHRLCPAIGHSVRTGHHPLALCRTHLHPAQRRRAPFRREAQAQCQSRAGRRQAHRADRRFHRARHDQPADRRDDARCRARPKSISASPARPPRIQLLLRRRHARTLQAARSADGRRADARLHQGGQPRLRLDRRPLPRGRRAARCRLPASSAMPASPATIPPR